MAKTNLLYLSIVLLFAIGFWGFAFINVSILYACLAAGVLLFVYRILRGDD
jgi:hypothetical protein